MIQKCDKHPREVSDKAAFSPGAHIPVSGASLMNNGNSLASQLTATRTVPRVMAGVERSMTSASCGPVSGDPHTGQCRTRVILF